MLLPVDSAGRVLELIILLEEFWQSDIELARAHPLFLCGREAHRMMEVAANNVVAMKRRIREREDTTRSVRCTRPPSPRHATPQPAYVLAIEFDAFVLRVFLLALAEAQTHLLICGTCRKAGASPLPRSYLLIQISLMARPADAGGLESWC